MSKVSEEICNRIGVNYEFVHKVIDDVFERALKRERDLARAELATLLPAVQQETDRIQALEAELTTLVQAAIALREYCISHVDVSLPDAIWVPFREALKNRAPQ